MTLQNPFDLFAPAFAERALLCIVLLAAMSAAVGWAIVLRDLPFFTHAVGSGAYPVLVLGIIAGASAAVSALLGAAVFAIGLALTAGVGRADAAQVNRGRRDALIGLAVAAALALGAVIASVAGSEHARLAVSPEALLFGSLLTVDNATATLLAAVTIPLAACAWLMAARWLATGFDASVSGHLGVVGADAALFACVALAAGASLPVTGALLAGALLVAPAAIAQLLTDRARRMPAYTFALALVIGVGGLYVSLNFDLPTGAAIAAVAGATFFVVASGRRIAESNAFSRRAPALAAAALAAVALAGCGGSTNSTNSTGTLKVVATTPQIADIVRNVGGSAVDVVALLPAGADPHEYEPKPSAISALGDADVIFRSGGDIDEWLLPALKAASPPSAPVDLSRSAILAPGAEADQINAHWYLSPENAARAAQKVRDTLVKADPSARETFRANATAYLNEIDAARARLAACVAKVPRPDRALAAGHDDFAYLADAFGLRIVAQLAQTGESAPSAGELQRSVDAARTGGARALVASRGEATRLEQQVASKLDIPLLELYADNLTTGDDASTLLGAIEYDVDRIADAVSDGSVRCQPAQ